MSMAMREPTAKAVHAHGITIDAKTGMRYGGSDPRSDGAAIGY
jgi:gamma-glutamyltranspeptidase/glutathione hydrolase